MHVCQGEAEAPQGKDTAGNRQTEQCRWPAPFSQHLRSSQPLSLRAESWPWSSVFPGSWVQPFLHTGSMQQAHRESHLAYNSRSQLWVTFCMLWFKDNFQHRAGLDNPQPIEQSPLHPELTLFWTCIIWQIHSHSTDLGDFFYLCWFPAVFSLSGMSYSIFSGKLLRTAWCLKEQLFSKILPPWGI